MVFAKNDIGDTPLHEACREGHADMVNLLLEVTPAVAYALNSAQETSFCIACQMGHFDVVHLMLYKHWLVDIEQLGFPLHHSIVQNHTSIVRVILEARPQMAWKVDKNESLPMHYAGENGNLDVISILLQYAPDSCMEYDNSGYTPIHLAVMNGEVDILVEIMTKTPEAFLLTTKRGETVFHLAVKSSKYEAFYCLDRFFGNKDLLKAQDRRGNTILHLTLSAEIESSYNIAEYLIKEHLVPFNAENLSGLTALDILLQNIHTEERQGLISLLIKAGGRKGSGKLAVSTAPAASIPKRNDKDVPGLKNKIGPTEQMQDLQVEALQNARNTIIIVAVLISTVTFTAGISPPGGVYQEGSLKGKAVAGRTTAFKVFQISNTIALFTSISVVITLLRIIAFRRKPLVRILTIADRVTWVALMFTGTSYVAATMVITPYSHVTEFMPLWTIAVGIGTLGLTFVITALILICQTQRKKKWEIGKTELHPSSSASYIEPNLKHGYHLF